VISESYKSGFRVAKSSVREIRTKAVSVREILMPEGVPDLELFLGELERFGITYDVVDDGYLPPGVEATCLPEKRLIYITASTYDSIVRNEDRARFTIFHELGHLLLAHSRSFHRDTTLDFPIWENSEWQADQFAAELLMPLDVIRAKNLTTAGELRKEFGVSHSAASIRLAKLRGRREIKNA
jgi:Zn-dependent protease with chaperone function